MLSRDLRGYHELMFGACVRNAMFFATLPYYVARKMRHGRLGSQGSDVLETGSALSGDTALGRKPNREAARTAPNPTHDSVRAEEAADLPMRQPDQR